jgi:molecular chaperone GrpE
MNATNTNPNPPEDADGAASAATASVDDLAQAIRQRDEYLDQLQRTRAEFANYQKRAKAQAESDRSYMVGALALDVLAVLDNFERAIDAARSANAPGIVEGLEMVHRQMLTALAKHGVEPIAVLGEPFDPNHHEAVMQQPDASKPEGTVVAELAKGYRLRDRVLRPAKVAVSVIPHAHPTS